VNAIEREMVVRRQMQCAKVFAEQYCSSIALSDFHASAANEASLLVTAGQNGQHTPDARAVHTKTAEMYRNQAMQAMTFFMGAAKGANDILNGIDADPQRMPPGNDEGEGAE